MITRRKEGDDVDDLHSQGFQATPVRSGSTLIAPWTTELRAACEKARADLRDRELVVDMNNVTTISQEGENVLLELMNEGVKFRGGGVFTKYILKQLAQRARRNLQEATR